MKLAISVAMYGYIPVWFPSYPLEEVVKRLARIGYHGIEIPAGSPHAYPRFLSSERRTYFRDLFRDHDIQVSAMMAMPGGGEGVNVASPIPEERANAIQYNKDTVDLLAFWESKILAYVAGWRVFGTTQQQARDWTLQALVEIGKHAADAGVTVVVEPTPTDSNLIETPDDALELIAQSGLPNVKAMFDVAHAIYRNESAADYVYRLGKSLGYVHLSDTDRGAPGTGSVDFARVVESLRDVGYDGWLSSEIGLTGRANQPDTIARMALEFMRGLGVE